jgi:hypothetical protein
VSLQLPQKFAKKNQHNQTHPPPATLARLFTTFTPPFTISLYQEIQNPPKISSKITLPLKSKVTGCIIAIADDFVPS